MINSLKKQNHHIFGLCFLLIAFFSSDLVKAAAPSSEQITRVVALPSATPLTGVLTYKENGQAEFITIARDGKGARKTWHGDLGQGWTNIISLHSENKNYYFIYDKMNGNAQLINVSDNGSKVVPVKTLHWSPNWNILKHFELNNSNFIIQYNSMNGYTKISTLKTETIATKEIYSDVWIKGRTQMVPMEINNSIYFFLFDETNGKAWVTQFHKPSDQFVVEGRWWGFWSNEASDFNSFSLENKTYLTRFKRQSKSLQILSYSETDKKLKKVGDKWIGGSESGTVVMLDKGPHWLSIDKDIAAIYQFDVGLKSVKKVWRGGVAD